MRRPPSEKPWRATILLMSFAAFSLISTIDLCDGPCEDLNYDHNSPSLLSPKAIGSISSSAGTLPRGMRKQGTFEAGKQPRSEQRANVVQDEAIVDLYPAVLALALAAVAAAIVWGVLQ